MALSSLMLTVFFVDNVHTQLIEKYEVQRFNIEKLHQTIDQLLVFKVERDKLQEEKELLMEVNGKYDFHIEELKNKVRLLMNELQSQKEGRGQSKGVQQQIKSFSMVDTSTQTSSSPTSSTSSFAAREAEASHGEGDGGSARKTSVAEDSPVTPPPPPPPPLGPEDGALIPPPPPIPFGK